jgi:hypothetical protein
MDLVWSIIMTKKLPLYLTQEELDASLPFLSEKRFDGIAWIGDPHFTDKRPSSRMDDFLLTLMRKMKFVSQHVTKNNLFPVILGDLIDKEREFAKRLMGAVVLSMKDFETIPVTIIGNHDLKTVDFLDNQAQFNESISENDDVYIEEDYNIIKFLAMTKTVHLIEDVSMLGRIRIKDKVVALGGIPYGGEWNPSMVLNWLKKKFSEKKWDSFNGDMKGLLGVDYIFIVSHDNLPFLGANIPVIVDVKKLDYVDMVVNGHIHSPLKPLNYEGMYIHNPGNIIRMALGAGYGAGKIYKPGFSIWNEGMPFDTLERIEIPHKAPEQIFNISNRHAGTQKYKKFDDLTVNKFTTVLHEVMEQQENKDYVPNLAKMIKTVGESLPLQVNNELSSLFVEIVDPDNVLGNTSEVFDYYLKALKEENKELKSNEETQEFL